MRETLCFIELTNFDKVPVSLLLINMMEIEGNFIEDGWGESLDNIGIEKIKEFLEKIRTTTDIEHCYFHVGVYHGEHISILQIGKNLGMYFTLDGPNNIEYELKSNAKDLNHAEELYSDLLVGNIEAIRNFFENGA